MAALYRLDDDLRIHPYNIDTAVATWRAFARCPRRELRGQGDDFIDYTGPDARQEIEDAIAVLPGRASRELAALVRPWDGLYRAKTVPNPRADPSVEWWRRRWND